MSKRISTILRLKLSSNISYSNGIFLDKVNNYIYIIYNIIYIYYIYIKSTMFLLILQISPYTQPTPEQ